MIQDHDRLYSFLRPYVDWLFRRSFRRFKYIGREHIPTDGAIIYAPNHVDALCDAMAVLGIDHGQKVFVARADIFKKPKLAKVLTWLKIMPINRMRDGQDAVLHNDETINRALATLRDRVPFCILPEGTHHPKHTLLPLQKGLFRIALMAYQQFGNEMPVYIVPVGLEYGDYYHLWDTLMVNIGEPICVNVFVEKYYSAAATNNAAEDIGTDSQPAAGEGNALDPKLILALREELTQRLREQILWVPDDEQYEQNWAALRDNPRPPFDEFKKKKVPAWLRVFLLALTFPLFVPCAIATFPFWVAWLIIQHNIADRAFHNSVQYVVQVLFYTLTLCLTMPLWWVVEEWRYQLRQLHR